MFHFDSCDLGIKHSKQTQVKPQKSCLFWELSSIDFNLFVVEKGTVQIVKGCRDNKAPVIVKGIKLAKPIERL